MKLDLWSTGELCGPLPATQPPRIEAELDMTDDFSNGQVDVLIGLDHLYRIILWRQVELSEGLRAVETVFGYVLHGRQSPGKAAQPQRQVFHCQQVQTMWDLDTVGVVSRRRPSTHGRCHVLSPPGMNESNGMRWVCCGGQRKGRSLTTVPHCLGLLK